MKRGLGAIWKDKKRSEAEGYHQRQTKRRQSGNDAGEFFEGKNSGEKSVSSRRTCLKETTTTRSCKTGSDFSYNAAAMKTLIDRLLPKKS